MSGKQRLYDVPSSTIKVTSLPSVLDIKLVSILMNFFTTSSIYHESLEPHLFRGQQYRHKGHFPSSLRLARLLVSLNTGTEDASCGRWLYQAFDKTVELDVLIRQDGSSPFAQVLEKLHLNLVFIPDWQL